MDPPRIAPLQELLQAAWNQHCENESRKVEKLCQTYTLKDEHLHAKSLELDGDQIVANIRRTLDTFKDFERHMLQRKFHNHMLVNMLPRLYMKSWEAHRERLMKEFACTVERQETLIVTARRMGKTVSVALFIASILVCVPHITIACFAPTIVMAREMVKLVTNLIRNHDEYARMISRGTRLDQLTLMMGETDKRTVKAYPGSNSRVSALCQRGGDLVLVFLL
jgi:hypothetical protein